MTPRQAGATACNHEKTFPSRIDLPENLSQAKQGDPVSFYAHIQSDTLWAKSESKCRVSMAPWIRWKPNILALTTPLHLIAADSQDIPGIDGSSAFSMNWG